MTRAHRLHRLLTRSAPLCLAILCLPESSAAGEPKAGHAGTSVSAPAARDGQHDFDFEIGTWKTHVKLLLEPLTGSSKWTEMNGTTVVSKVLGGRANLVELEADFAGGGHFSGLSLRLYNPVARQWSLNFSNAKSGALATPTVGEFKDGRGEFYDQELLDGRAIFVKFVITPLDADTIRFEQSYSADGGRTWELNWDATDTRVR